MRHDTLAAWLAWLEALHPSAIDLGLERVGAVAGRMGVARLPCPVIIVAGTNGKGSSVAMLEALLSAGGHRVAAYTSPHLLRYNERIRIAGREAADDALCAAFERVDRARDGISLTYFEFGTLAALDLFLRARPDVAILEVGLGGRLDAVNLVDADIALVTAIGLDHVEWLGDDRDAIGAEKAGIFRPGRPAVCVDTAPPAGLIRAATGRDTPLYRIGRDFGFDFDDAGKAEGGSRWSWWGPERRIDDLPAPGLTGAFQYHNAAGALMVSSLLPASLAVSEAALGPGLARVRLPGRFQLLPGSVTRILDVAHNVDSARALAANLAVQPAGGATRAVAAMLGDKDIDGVVSSMSDVVDEWHVATLPIGRSAPAERLRRAVAGQSPAVPATVHPDVVSAYRAALSNSRSGDRIVVFGSFYTVGEILRLEQPGYAAQA
jgi:dihydrofolate synthase / folylpolyglutamate synthase